MIDLINRSYILLDISDTFQNENAGNAYYDHVRQKIFENESSIMSVCESSIGSYGMQITDQDLSIGVIRKLESYVQFCQLVKKNFDISENYILGNFLMNIKARIIQKYNMSQLPPKSRVENLLYNIKKGINVLMSTILIVFSLNIEKDNNIENEEILNSLENSICHE